MALRTNSSCLSGASPLAGILRRPSSAAKGWAVSRMRFGLNSSGRRRSGTACCSSTRWSIEAVGRHCHARILPALPSDEPEGPAFRVPPPGQRRVFVGRSQIGGPAAGIVVEEMGVRGVRDFITFGACESLRKDTPIGSFVVPTFAYPDEGTSRHYGAPKRPRPSPAILPAISEARETLGVPARDGG